MDTSTPTFMLGFLGDLLTVWAPFLLPLALIAAIFLAGRTMYTRATANARIRATRRAARSPLATVA